MNADTAKTAAQAYAHDFEAEIPTTVNLLQSIRCDTPSTTAAS